ncbi:anthranilate synthase component I family protein [Fulvivirgaceae bacterium PWU4]|uniref:Anthranilate synthase component 1 n=1 Tax=Chryseosolibacter histidini TaxID=2782349 RepID=A0AAP2DL11_9BACT|nr:anthranilate synthase component I family protein [Chryseosolibacter histidini]MBT1698295.1 anthranilate synthase component I family protein [Chryseosolibacter histidini]
MKYKISTFSKKLLADTLTPVNIYLKLRDVFAGSILLESSDYHGHENSLSFICCDAIASFEVKNNVIETRFPDGKAMQQTISGTGQVIESLEAFKNSFEITAPAATKYVNCGLFGYFAYDSVRFFEDVSITARQTFIPDVLYKLYRYIIVVDHFSNELSLFEHKVENGAGLKNEADGLSRIEQIIFSNRFSTYKFSLTNGEESNFSDDEFLRIIEKGKEHCFRGDVFQIVLSRRFTCGFRGDEFNVYRALRSINPSPYLFYFDYGSFKLFGSSPEAQLQVNQNIANIYPIAGTFRRSGNDQEDAELANKLAADEKENAEHVMLVDLARNDMSRNAAHVNVEVFKEIQFYSHVIHLVSKVTGKVKDDSSVIRIAADTFPAGTLSGAPKHMAMTLIDKYENVNRGFYGGAIGFLGFDNSFNHAIMIRTFLSHGNRLIYQAGAGVVAKSKAESELQEVNNKLTALRKAVHMAEKL